MDKKHLISGMIIILLTAIFSGCVQDDSTNNDYDSGQVWALVDEQSGQTATLTMDSSGYFTGSGWVGGGSAGIPSYNIYITNGRMYSTSMTFDAYASYNNGDGTISATGIGTLNANFPSATSASGTWSGTISDSLGDRTFTNNWQGTKVSGGGQSSPQEEFDFDVDVDTHIVTIKQGEIAVINVTVKIVKGTAQPVVITMTDWGYEFDITALLAKSTVTPTETTKLYVETTCDTPADEYLFTVLGETTGTFKTSMDSTSIIVEENQDCGSTLPPYVPFKPTSLLATDAEYYNLYVTFENWGFDFNELYDTYSNQGFANNWVAFWIGSEYNEEQRIYFDLVGDKWRPRAIP